MVIPEGRYGDGMV
nr:hypothetical protein [Tanacetum cinerariifolium]